MAPVQEKSSEISEETPVAVKTEEKKPERAPPPTWLNKSFLQEALKQESDVYGSKEERIEDIQVTYATGVGDNYCSCIFRVRAQLRGQSPPRSLVVKCMPEGDMFQRIVEESRLFEKEAHMFSEVIPAMQALLEEAAPGRYPQLTARCLSHGAEPGRFLVVQDLCADGFRLGDRRVGMDLPHALLAHKALGWFHGASAVLWKRRPELMETFDNPFLHGWSQEQDPEEFIDTAADAMDSWTDFPGDYANKVRSLKGKFNDKLIEIHNTRKDNYNVLIHGDFWLNNMLFRHEGEDVSEVRLLDLQMCHVTNPVFDLMLFRYTSLQEDVFLEHWETLLQAYAASMAEVMRALGEDPPTLEDIRRDLYEGRHFAIAASLMWMPLVRLDKGKFDVEDALANGTDSQAGVYKTEVFRRWMEILLPILEKEYVFDL